MKILHTADWHIGQFKGPVVDGVNLRSQDTIKCLEYMVEVAQKEKPDIVCISGDIFHQEQIGPVRYSDEMIHATNIITALAHFASYVIVMRGTPNHDGSGQFRVLKRMLLNVNNVCVVTEPFVIKTRYADIACIPGFDKQEFRAKFPGLSADEENLAWTKYISDIVLALRAECENTPILMAHYTVPGCNMESGQTSFFTNFEPVIPREALEAAGYEAVLLGHIHRPQILNGLHNVFYSGAINAMNFNDEGQDRGFWIHEFNEKGTLIKGHRYTTPYRQFCTITWDSDEVGNYIREGIMYLHRTGIPEGVADKIVRVRYSCTSEQKKALNIPLLQKNLYEVGAFYVADIEAEVKHFNCFNELSNDETFICWDSAKQDVWVRQPPSFAIRNHKLLRPRIDAYQDFLPRTTVSGITMVGIRTAESVQRLQNIASMTKAGNKMTAKKQVFPIYDWTDNDVWLFLLRNHVDIPEIYLFLWQSGSSKRQMRVSQFFSVDTARSLVKMNEYYPDLMERIIRREPNAYLAALYWDSEMFGRSSRKRKEAEEGQEQRDYRQELIHLFNHMDVFFDTPHKRHVAERYRNFFMAVSAIATSADCKHIYEGLISGDPKMRAFRALYQRVYGRYINDAKKGEHHGQ